MNSESVRFASGMNISLAFWQVFSPFILGYSDNALAALTGIIVGVLILGMAWFRMLRPTVSVIPGWVNILLGAFLAISPFALGFHPVPTALWNDITVGIAVVFFGIVGLLTAYTSEMHKPH